ncbi:YbaN family protein [Salinibacillus xinjiangensis]|uniref:DUF454 family protein n=1 Tax=Salinibacillus xinjiangensis TaxID=1229268 RepID=A0A6G1X920_9BACI|nr:YbaN family protein [Salinibacillus xinjiangensis]MRG87501.1 DUF454 family protein [Salinibacillus xinjiangensis]
MQGLLRIFLIGSGTISLSLGVVGIVLPLIPTTPLLLLSAACFVRSSDRLYQWLIHNKWFGRYIQDYRDGKGIPLKAKVMGVSVLWLSIGYTTLFVVPLVLVKVLLVLIASYFTWFILHIKTRVKS